MTDDFHDRHAEGYDVLMDTPRNRAVRAALYEMVAHHGPAGGAVLDLGCGTGIDAFHFASKGRRVLAYDVSSGMMEVLARRCREHVDRGAVVPVVGDRDALNAALDAFGPVRVLSSNFAAVNVMPDLGMLRWLVRERIEGPAAVVLGVANPFFPRDMTRAWWWAGLARAAGRGSVDSALPDSPQVRRHFVSSLRKALGPGFELREQRSLVGDRVRETFPLKRLGHMRLLAFVRS